MNACICRIKGNAEKTQYFKLMKGKVAWCSKSALYPQIFSALQLFDFHSRMTSIICLEDQAQSRRGLLGVS